MRNQCDGCQAGFPIEEGHFGEYALHMNEGKIHMVCTKSLYKTMMKDHVKVTEVHETDPSTQPEPGGVRSSNS